MIWKEIKTPMIQVDSEIVPEVTLDYSIDNYSQVSPVPDPEGERIFNCKIEPDIKATLIANDPNYTIIDPAGIQTHAIKLTPTKRHGDVPVAISWRVAPDESVRKWKDCEDSNNPHYQDSNGFWHIPTVAFSGDVVDLTENELVTLRDTYSGYEIIGELS